MANTQEKIVIAKKELKMMKKKGIMTDSEKVVDLENKIRLTEDKCKELLREIKQLKRLQHDQGNELVELDITQDYPEKIRSLMEEIKYSRDKNIELMAKLENEEKQAKR